MALRQEDPSSKLVISTGHTRTKPYPKEAPFARRAAVSARYQLSPGDVGENMPAARRKQNPPYL